jgi:hypothetical protein
LRLAILDVDPPLLGACAHLLLIRLLHVVLVLLIVIVFILLVDSVLIIGLPAAARGKIVLKLVDLVRFGCLLG